MLKLENIRFAVRESGRRQEILKGVSLEVPEGSLVVLTGQNGSGKSTLAKIIMGVLNPEEGRIIFDGEEINELSVTERAKKGIVFSFQQPVRLKGITVYQLIEIAAENNLAPEEVREAVQEVGIGEEYLAREVGGRLSGGELKRIEIASVLARGAKLMIFDEPEAGIDLWSFDDLIRVFRKLKRAGRTMIIISHQERILKIADRVVLMNKGKIVQDGAPEEILPEILRTKNGIR